MDLLSRFKQSLNAQKLFRPRERVFVACSGGPDSTALYFLLKASAPELKIKLGLLHFNHKLRGRASDRDELFVKKLARREKVPFVCGKSALRKKEGEKKSIEEAARHERYAFFQKCRVKKIVTAHTQDDQAETILMRVLQGTGPQGLGGIRRVMKMGQLQAVRPLLDFSKQEVLEFLKKNRIPFCKDQTNNSPKFLRNRIRAQLLPMLAREFNPRVKEALARIPAILEEENQLLETLKAEAWKKCFKNKSGQSLELKRKIFQKHPDYLRFWVLDGALKSLNPASGMSFEAWQRIKPRLADPVYRQSLPKDLDLELTPSKVRIYLK